MSDDRHTPSPEAAMLVQFWNDIAPALEGLPRQEIAPFIHKAWPLWLEKRFGFSLTDQEPTT
jgi:hypothetical protein